MVAAADWVLAELVRICYKVDLDRAQAIVDALIQRRSPLVQEFNGFPKVLRSDLTKSEAALVLLFNRGQLGASSADVPGWLRVTTKEARRILRRHDERVLVHFDEQGDAAFLTHVGTRSVEDRWPVAPA